MVKRSSPWNPSSVGSKGRSSGIERVCHPASYCRDFWDTPDMSSLRGSEPL